jgi:hypothetical protein
MLKALTKKATGGPFDPLHTSTYGLKVMERCPDTQRVISVRCQFCIKSGVEVDPAKLRQRVPRKGNMAWTESFRTNKYTDHHEQQHPIEWARYKAFSFDEKAKFFAGMTPYTNTMLSHINVGLAAAPLELYVLSTIVDIVISDMFFHPDKQGGTTQTTALKSFKRVDGVDNYYEVRIPNPVQFRLVVSWVSGGASFRQCVRFVADTRRILGTTFKILANSNRITSNWDPQRSANFQLCKNHSRTQSPSYRHNSRSSQEPIYVGILVGKRRINPSREILSRQPHSYPCRRKALQPSSHRHLNV